jgi:hypothetical protein
MFRSKKKFKCDASDSNCFYKQLLDSQLNDYVRCLLQHDGFNLTIQYEYMVALGRHDSGCSIVETF